MADLVMRHSGVLDKILDSTKRINVLEGGSSSTKTWSLLQWHIINCLICPGQSYTIGRLKMTWTKATVLKDFITICEKYNIPVSPDFNINRPDQIYYLNKSEISFIGLDEPQKVHGRRQDNLWLNEAMEISEKEANQLMIRTRNRIFMDYNPSSEVHWIYDNIISRPDCDFFHSTMRDNPFLEQSIIDELNRLEQTDPTAYKIYNLGLRAQQKGLIFHNWDIVREVPLGASLIAYGLDFGFVNDPTALVAIYESGGEIYLDELLYERGLVNVPIKDKNGDVQKNISDRLVSNGIRNSDEIIADSVEMKSINELYAIGWNIKPAHKPKITFGIDVLRRYRLHVTEKSVNTIKEFRNYKWAVDKNGEQVRPEKPIDDYNHIIDASRYVAVYKLALRFTGIKRAN